MRLIDADAFKEYMRKALEETRGCYPDKGEWAEAVTEQFCKDIDDQPTVEPEPHWIPCSEKLPEKCGVYLVSGSNWVWLCELVQIMTVYGWANDARNPVVTAWMPLPEPYKENKDERH